MRQALGISPVPNPCRTLQAGAVIRRPVASAALGRQYCKGEGKHVGGATSPA